MKKVCILLLLAGQLSVQAQENTTTGKTAAQRQQVQNVKDSAGEQLAAQTAEIWRVHDSIEKKKSIDQMTANSINYMVRWQNERQAAQKKKMFLYLGMGIVFLVVLIAGLLRKGKAKR